MTSISRLFTTLFTTYRQSWSDDKSTEALIGTFYGHIQKSDAGLTGQLDGSFTKSYNIWCAKGTDVEESDTLTDADGYSYSVRIVRELNEGFNQHIKLTVERDRKYESV